MTTILDTSTAPPQHRGDDGALTWFVRGESFVVEITKAKRGTRLLRKGQSDESMVFVPPGVTAEVLGELTAEEDSLLILPPGDREIVVHEEGLIFRIFSARSSKRPIPGHRARVYPLKDVVTGDAFGRIYRSTNLMVNIFEPFAAARDQSALSPHSHDDFEQGTLTITGRFEHYLRTPWGKDRRAWREDLVAKCESPSLTIIPAGMIHTTAWLDAHSRMIDIFSPPRVDFSKWVRNGSDYPI